MTYVNVWLGIPEDDHNELNNRRGTEDNVGPAAAFVDGQLDPDVVQPMYAVRTSGPQSWHLWSVILDERDGAINAQVNAFRQEFPGTQMLGAWLPDGSQLLDDQGQVMYDIPDTLDQYMPDGIITDVNLPFGWQPREFV